MAGRNYSSHKFSQVLRKDGTLDVDKLARECSRDVFEDKRHRRVDDMKKKAIGTSATTTSSATLCTAPRTCSSPCRRARWRSSSGAGRAGRTRPRRARLGETGRRAPRLVRGSSRGAARSWRTRPTRRRDHRPRRRSSSTATGAAAAFGPARGRTAVAALAETRRRREKYLARHGPTVLAPLLASELDATLVAEVLDTVCRPWVEAVPAAAPPPPPPAGEGAAAPPPPLEDASSARRAQRPRALARSVARAPRFSLNLLMFEKELTDTIGRRSRPPARRPRARGGCRRRCRRPRRPQRGPPRHLRRESSMMVRKARFAICFCPYAAA